MGITKELKSIRAVLGGSKANQERMTLSLREVARDLRISAADLNALLVAGFLRSTPMGRDRVIPKSELVRFRESLASRGIARIGGWCLSRESGKEAA